MFNSYQQEASKTFKPAEALTADQARLLDWAIGLGGESGEVLDIIKHAVVHHEGLTDKMALAKELGDCLWYVSAIATSCGIDLGDVAALNRAKLNHRYISGNFTFEEAANRHDSENKFEDTAIYKSLKARICGSEVIPFNVIVIGPDGSGKTTLTEALSARTGMQRIKCDYRQENKALLAKQYLFMQTGIIYDRFYYPDDLIYSEVKNIELAPEYVHEMHDILTLLIASNTVFIYLDADINLLRERSANWADDYVKVEQLEKIQDVYKRYLGEITAAGVPVIERKATAQIDSPNWITFVDDLIKEIQSRVKFAARPEILGRIPK